MGALSQRRGLFYLLQLFATVMAMAPVLVGGVFTGPIGTWQRLPPAPGAATCSFRVTRVLQTFGFDATPHDNLMIHTTTISEHNKNSKPNHFDTKRVSPLNLGQYRIAACPKALPDGRFAAQVSIASGSGSASTDRVMRFVDDFPTFDAAARYAVAQGIDWVKDTLRQRGRPYSAAVLSPADPICI